MNKKELILISPDARHKVRKVCKKLGFQLCLKGDIFQKLVLKCIVLGLKTRNF